MIYHRNCKSIFTFIVGSKKVQFGVSKCDPKVTGDVLVYLSVALF